MTRNIYILVFALALLSCNQREAAKANTELLYFDLKGYFGKEISRLKNAKPKVSKTVSINGVEENKTILINNWEKELAIFVNADINKNSWKGSFKVSRKDSTDSYTSDSRKIPIKKITVTHQASGIGKIEVVIDNKNILYQSHDTLTYIPDHSYQIKKQQKIRLLAPKSYAVMARFNP